MFRKRLKESREKLGLTQVALAEKLGISKDLYNKYERTDIRPGFETVRKMSDHLNVSIDYLLGSTDIPTPQADLVKILENIKSGNESEEKGFIMGFRGNSQEIIELTKDEYREIASILEVIRKSRNGENS